MKKDDREIMEILEAYDLTGSAHSAAQLVGVDAKTVRRYVAARDSGADPYAPVERDSLVDPFRDKIAEWVTESKGRVRADVAHDRLVAMGYVGSDRTTRRAVAAAKKAWRAGNGRSYKPWVPEPRSPYSHRRRTGRAHRCRPHRAATKSRARTTA